MNGMLARQPAWIDRNGNGKGAIHTRGYAVLCTRGQGKGAYVCRCSRCIRVPGYLMRNTPCEVYGNTAIERKRDAAAGQKAFSVYDQRAAGGYARTAAQREPRLPYGEAKTGDAGENQDGDGDGKYDQSGSAAARSVMRSWMVRALWSVGRMMRMLLLGWMGWMQRVRRLPRKSVSAGQG